LRIADVDAIVALIADDVRLTMPPLPLEYVGLEDARRFYAMVAARSGRRRLIQTKANGQAGRSRSTPAMRPGACSARPA